MSQNHSYHPHVMSVQTNIVIFVALLVLLILTVGAAYLDLGMLAVPVAVAIATVKAILILLYFMHVKFGKKLIALFAVGAAYWIVILLIWTINDYATRDMLNVVGK
jgi:cytochrome c oxidase subunit 4